MMEGSTLELEKTPCCVCGSASSETIAEGEDFEYDTVPGPFRYQKCTQCGHHYLNPRPTPRELERIYPESYGNYSNSERFSLTFALKATMESFFLKKLFRTGKAPDAILDVGCGDGRLLEIIRKIVPANTVTEGIEISGKAAQQAIRKGFSVKTGSIEQVSLEPASMDYIFMIQVIEHLHNPKETLHKLYKSLKKGGLIIIETPDTTCLDYHLFKKRHWGGYHFPRHFNLFNTKNLEKFLSSVGLTTVSTCNKLQPVHWVWSIHHILQEWTGKNSFTNSFNIKNTLWMSFFTLIDAIQLYTSGKSSNQRIIAHKQ